MLANAQFWGGCRETTRPSARGAAVGAPNSHHGFFSAKPMLAQDRPARLESPTDLFATVLEIATDAIVLHDVSGTISFWNGAAGKEWGWSAREAVGKLVGPLLFVDQAHYARVQEALRDQNQWSGHVATMSKDGKLMVRHASMSRWHGDAHSSPGVLMIYRPAQTLLGESTAILRLERLEALARAVSKRVHELNNALSPITMSVDLLRDRIRNPEDQRLLAALEDATEWTTRVTRDLRTDVHDAIEAVQLGNE